MFENKLNKSYKYLYNKLKNSLDFSKIYDIQIDKKNDIASIKFSNNKLVKIIDNVGLTRYLFPLKNNKQTYDTAINDVITPKTIIVIGITMLLFIGFFLAGKLSGILAFFGLFFLVSLISGLAILFGGVLGLILFVLILFELFSYSFGHNQYSVQAIFTLLFILIITFGYLSDNEYLSFKGILTSNQGGIRGLGLELILVPILFVYYSYIFIIGFIKKLFEKIQLVSLYTFIPDFITKNTVKKYYLSSKVNLEGDYLYPNYLLKSDNIKFYSFFYKKERFERVKLNAKYQEKISKWFGYKLFDYVLTLNDFIDLFNNFRQEISNFKEKQQEKIQNIIKNTKIKNKLLEHYEKLYKEYLDYIKEQDEINKTLRYITNAEGQKDIGKIIDLISNLNKYTLGLKILNEKIKNNEKAIEIKEKIASEYIKSVENPKYVGLLYKYNYILKMKLWFVSQFKPDIYKSYYFSNLIVEIANKMENIQNNIQKYVMGASAKIIQEIDEIKKENKKLLKNIKLQIRFIEKTRKKIENIKKRLG